MTTIRRITLAAMAGVLLLTSAAAASSSRGPATQIRNNLDRLVRPIGREIERLGQWTRFDARFANHGRAAGSGRGFEALLLDDSGESVASSSGPARSTGEPFQWSKVVAAGKAIEIKGVNGDISASRSAGKEVEVRATKRGWKSDPDEVTIEVIEHEDGVTICAKYPSPPGKQENECAPGDRGHSHTWDNDVRVDFEVRVPAGVRLIMGTVNGEIRAEDLESPVEAATVNGSVRVSTSGYASAATVNGSIAVSLGDAAWTEPISFNTVNGAISITLPAGLDADVRAETLNGVIRSDFPLTVSGKISRHRLQGSIGKGGRRLDLETVNGNISLRSAAQRSM